MTLRRTTIVSCLIAVLTTTATGWSQQSAPKTPVTELAMRPTLQQRLERLCEKLDAQRIELHIPGMAIAIVKDDKLILARGFGVADLESGRPVTEETIFAIGSSSKAFTATLIGMLIDEGIMSWDDPITKHLPWFELPIDSKGDADDVLLRDLLSHQTGFARMGILWAGGAIEREEVLRTALNAEPYAGFRKAFHYNNVMFLAAGQASAAASGADWDSLLDRRILSPLGMDDSNTSVAQAQSEPGLSLGYTWDEDAQAFELQPMRVLDAIAPAGAINSNVLDMAKWVRFQLNRGEVDGARLVNADRIDETWQPQIEIAPGISYGMGWMIGEWKDQRVIEHGGNIDGFGAQVALLPESGLGFVLLTNVSATPLQRTSMNLVWESILGEWEDETGALAGAATDFDDYTGTYLADFGSLKDTKLTVLIKGEKLAVDVPGQMVFTLKEPDEEGKRYFELTDEVAVSFPRDDKGVVTALVIHQGGLDLEAPREGVEIVAEIEEPDARKYFGLYHSENLDVDIKVLIRNGRLAFDVPNQLAFELRMPDDDGRWRFRADNERAVVFNEDAEGRIESVTYLDPSGAKETLVRVGETEVEALPTVDDLLKLRTTDDRAAAMEAAGAIRMTGTARFVNAGVTGTSVSTFAGSGRFREDLDFGRFGWLKTAVNVSTGATDSNLRPFDELTGDRLTQALHARPAALVGDWREHFDSITVTDAAELDGAKVFVVKLKSGETLTVIAMVAPDTGDVLQYKVNLIVPALGTLPTTVRLDDYRDVHGMRIPFHYISSNDQSGKFEMRIDSVELGVEVDDAFFTLTNSNASAG